VHVRTADYDSIYIGTEEQEKTIMGFNDELTRLRAENAKLRRQLHRRDSASDDGREEVVATLRELSRGGDRRAFEALRAMGEPVIDPQSEVGRRLANMVPRRGPTKPYWEGRSRVFPTQGER
jgi:hypothetical protein